ncbi:MAG: DUF4174 domain-containing protein [Rhodobacterales bacterium]|nr:DUF4174 domain-containing protein [Rhodobacterales bacterium]
MKPFHILVLAAFLPAAAAVAAQEAPPPAAESEPAPVLAPVSAADLTMDSLLWQVRPVVVFADSPADPNFVRQMDLLAVDQAGFLERDVVIVTDTDPAAMTEWRRKLRPRGFSLVLMDKDLKAVLRKPLPWDAREIERAIDKFPLRRQEILEQRPAGR